MSGLDRTDCIRQIKESGDFDEKWYLSRYPDVVLLGMDPVEHFLTIGADLLRNPSAGFDTAFYLGVHPDVARSNVNPLLHYIRHGREEGRRPMPSAPRNMATGQVSASGSGPGQLTLAPRPVLNDSVLLTCWLAEPDPIHTAIAALGRDLARRGMRLVTVGNSTPMRAMHDVSLLRTPFQLSHYKLGGKWHSGEAVPAWMLEVREVECKWLSRSDAAQLARREEVDAACDAAYRYWRSIFTSTAPGFVFVWGSTSPLSKLHLGLCRELGIPCIVLERGHFFGTVSLDLIGQFAHGSVGLKPHSLLQEKRELHAEGWQRIVEWERSSGSVPYARNNRDFDTLEYGARLRQLGSQVFLFIGANDLGSGCAYTPEESSECHSLLFHGSKEAAVATRQALRRVDPGAVMLIKPHPSDRADYSDLCDETTLLADNLNINELIALSDVCISMSTTAFAKCILEGKPVVSLALSDLSAKGIMYECGTPTDITVMLRAASERDGFESRLENGRKYLQYAFDEHLVGVIEGVPTRLCMADVAEYVYRHVVRFGRRHVPGEIALDKVLASHVRGSRGALAYTASTMAESRDSTSPPRKVAVVVPIYGDAAVTRDCIESVLAADVAVEFELILVNDRSPFEDIERLLAGYAGRRGIRVLQNKVNQGFPGAANRGMLAAGSADVIILNSDTTVPSGWIDRLQAHAYRDDRVATVTPFSNNASVFSFPAFPTGAGLEHGSDAGRVDSAMQAANPGASVTVPVGHGFCIYIKRNCIDKVGYFDEVAFGRGYSEEVDFCLRARELGFRHVCAADLFVAHVGGVSFSDAAEQARSRNREIIRSRFPDYFAEIRAFIEQDPLKPFRMRCIEVLSPEPSRDTLDALHDQRGLQIGDT